ncbi:glycosyltransferase [Marinobacter sp. HL-58]|uniref:glycosyltransferase n=1 Tax=Marinobacter sp. HL-58 TaxID=1479237 RepID=UPI000484A060|nr:glycosyltransferase [Marinobacter sp. HL-58]KPQ02367.1 MAG: Glycosyltransferases involved in cell wall biogenesis [Marinobacter sp. HL-58]
MGFSVLMSVYQGDDPQHLTEALRSIWDDQSVRPSEIVLVFDGPVPTELERVVDQWKATLGPVLITERFEVNQGLGAALHRGLSLAGNELVARMDADDIASSERFAIQLAMLEEREDIDILGSFVQEISFDGKPLGLRTMPSEHHSIVANLWASPIIHPTVMMRRSRVLSSGNYDPACRRRQDYELWFRCAANGLRFHNLALPLLHYRFGAHTHKKQLPRLALEQALIGYRGAGRLGMPFYQRAACFIPFIRSLLPAQVQHLVYKLLTPMDPRRKSK